MNVPILGGPQSSLKQGDELGPQIRLLICFQCKTIDELPDYVGDPRHDTLLQIAIERNHTDRVTEQTHVGQMHKVPLKYWSRPEVKKDIIKQLSEGSGGLADVDATFYDSRSTFFDDAMACFKAHNRPKGRCPDWRDDKKRLVPDTAKERKELGFAKVSETGPKVYLCDFCPAKAFMITKARDEAGQYK